MTQKWYVLRVKSRAERLVASQLERDGFVAFLPCVENPRPNARSVFAPLFPGYLFLRVDIDSADAKLARERSGVLGWLRFGDTIPFLTNEIVNRIRRRVQEINSAGGHWRRFRQGEIVRVVAGNLESLGQVVDEPESANGQVRVLLDFMGRMVSARVPWHALSPMNQEPEIVRPRQLPRRTRGKGRWIRGISPRATEATHS